jgi:hypothetical protein
LKINTDLGAAGIDTEEEARAWVDGHSGEANAETKKMYDKVLGDKMERTGYVASPDVIDVEGKAVEDVKGNTDNNYIESADISGKEYDGETKSSKEISAHVEYNYATQELTSGGKPKKMPVEEYEKLKAATIKNAKKNGLTLKFTKKQIFPSSEKILNEEEIAKDFADRLKQNLADYHRKFAT